MYSMTMHILGGLVQAAMKSTTFGWRSAVITRTSSMKLRAVSLPKAAGGIILTATSVPLQRARYTSP
jgi:hypothetical protein